MRVQMALCFATVVLWIPASASAVTVFEDGFESGDLSAWDDAATDRYTVTETRVE